LRLGLFYPLTATTVVCSILMQILCVVSQKKLQLLGDVPQTSSLLLCPPNNPVRSTSLHTTAEQCKVIQPGTTVHNMSHCHESSHAIYGITRVCPQPAEVTFALSITAVQMSCLLYYYFHLIVTFQVNPGQPGLSWLLFLHLQMPNFPRSTTELLKEERGIVPFMFALSIYSLGPFYGAIAVLSVTHCRCRRCVDIDAQAACDSGSVRQ